MEAFWFEDGKILSTSSQSGAGGCGLGAGAGPLQVTGEMASISGALGGGDRPPCSGPGRSPAFPGGDSRKELQPQENWDLVIKPSGTLSWRSGQLSFPPPFLLKMVEIPGRGSFHAGHGGGGLCHCHPRHTPWAGASATPTPPHQGEQFHQLLSAAPAGEREASDRSQEDLLTLRVGCPS